MASQNQSPTFPITNIGTQAGGTASGTQQPLTIPSLGQLSQSGTYTELERSEIDKNRAKEQLFKVLKLVAAVLALIITGGGVALAFTIASDIASLKAQVSNQDKIINQLREDKNRDVDRLQKDIDDLKNPGRGSTNSSISPSS
jgi:hypothetical protein